MWRYAAAISIRVWIWVLLAGCLPPQRMAAESEAARIFNQYPARVEQLLSGMDLEYPGMEPVKAALQQGDRSLALQALLQHMREKPVASQLIPALPPARKDILELADDATQGIFTIQSRTYTQPLLSDGHLNWEDRGPNGDKEWAWMLNRHPHFEFLVTAFESTGNAKYLECISRHLIDWIPVHPPPDRVTFSTSWRALEAARRIMDSWLVVYTYERDQAAVSDEALFLMLSAIPEHANYLRNHYSFWGGNHKMTEKMAIAICALVWTEFRESREWLRGALEVISEELYKQTYADGSYKELANHYQKVVAENYLRLLKMLDGNPLIDVDPPFRARVEALWDYFAYVSRPSGFGPLNNDSSLEDNFTYLTDSNRYFQRLDWQYILSHGASGIPPANPPTRYFAWAGHAVMRNHWGADAHWAFFDIGPHGSAHQHWDRLHLSISIGQQDLLVDSGRYTYKPGPLREYFRYGVGHNVVRVDETDSRRPPNSVTEPMEVFSQIEDQVDAFAATVRFHPNRLKFEQVKHRRMVVYVRDAGWLVIDELVGYGEHKYDTFWNFHPDCLVTQLGHDALDIELGDESHATLRLLNAPVNGGWDLARGQLEPEIRGWYSWAYNERKPGTSARYRYTARQPRLNVWWLQPNPPKAVLDGAEGEVRLLQPLQTLEDLEVEIGSGHESRVVRWVDGKVEIVRGFGNP